MREEKATLFDQNSVAFFFLSKIEFVGNREYKTTKDNHVDESQQGDKKPVPPRQVHRTLFHENLLENVGQVANLPSIIHH
jgi:hypothetical protein